MKVALKEIKILQEKYDDLYRDFCFIKDYANSLEVKLSKIQISNKHNRLEEVMKSSKEAMERYTNKLRKEILDAKQEQS